MSKYEWESGSLLLPAAAVSDLKKSLREWTNTFHADVRTEAVHLHKTVLGSTRSTRLYRERLAGIHEAPMTDQWGRHPQSATTMVKAAARQVLERILFDHEHNQVALHQPNVSDVEKVAPRATNRTTTFNVVTLDGHPNATISFDARTVTWAVAENNRAVEEARKAPIAVTFFAALNRLVWTRGTGGHFVGNNEFNRDDNEAGGGANYLTSTYGPLGDAAKIEDFMSRGFSKKQSTEMVLGPRTR
jgi:hypothetical protein